MDSHLQVARGRMDVDQGGPHFFSGASHVTGRDFSVRNAGRDMIIVNPAPISGPDASIEEVTAWLKGANFRAIYRVSLEERMDNTGNWFIATVEFGEFVRQKGTVVWATGIPGSGKTTLASISIEHLEDTFSRRSDVAVLYAFLRYSEKPTLLQIIAGLLTQLVSCNNFALSHLLPVYQRAKTHRDELSCSEAVKLLRSSLNLFSDTFIVIDGLDEVDDATKDDLLRVLIPLNAHILFTCRPLELFMGRHTPRALHIPVQAQTKDIELYVAERIKESTTLASILSEHPGVAESFTALIKEKSNGMFLLARLQMELVLERCANIGSLLKTLKTLPSGIHDMYRLTMDRISSLSEEKVSLAHRAFLWILYAKEGLSPEDLQHALTFSYENKKFVEDDSVSIPVLLSICCGLVTVEDKENWLLGKRKVIRLIHYSTQEFMKGLIFSHLPKPHDLLAVTSVACVETHLEMLTTAVRRNAALVASPKMIATRQRPLLHYALFNWGHHAKICDDQWILSPSIPSFLSRHGTYALVNHCHDDLPILSEVSGGLQLAVAYDLVNLISSRTFPYYPTHGTKTPFHVAAQYGKTAALRALLENYSGVHVKDEVGRTPLHHCVVGDSKREPEVVRQLLNLSSSDTWRAFPSEIVDINAQDNQGCSAFFEACRRFRLFPLEILNDTTRPIGRTLQLFTSHPGIDVDLLDSTGDTLFSAACSFENDAVAQFLISSLPNLKVDTRNKWGETPFMRACDSSSKQLVEWFLSRDPGGCHLLHQEDNEGNTALEGILAYEGLPTAQNKHGRKFRRLQMHEDWEDEDDLNDMIRILSDSRHASHVRMVRAGHESLPIYHIRASSRMPHQPPTVHVSLGDGHRRYEDERTSLMLLASYPAAVKYLVSENENNPDFINAQDNDGRCALMYVCFGQDPEGAEFSIEILTSCPSVNIHLRDRDGMSALDHALYSKNIDPFNALEVLLRHPSWNPSAVRNAVIAAAQQEIIESEYLECLLIQESVQKAFSTPGAGRADGFALITALRHRGDCKEMLERRKIFRDPIFCLFLGEEGGDHDLEEYPDRPTPAAIRQATIAAVNNPLTSIEQLESHFGQKEVKDAFVWDIDVRDPDTILLINCLAWRSGCSALFDDLFGPLERCEGRHRACVHALIRL
ncbi:hypothetical protein DFP72DRAFT_427244 [Ephemerocybe angulata]|uniref:Nephrocystin 3-like N-terminal domain-containing protein n=1 Tax=Ephemerocybe angulata TaxID=980116 RepID=A0A8H6HVV1_9AGAR|nr:hypothetical protein DFP72DRAFT_427244 [Tulosesus angulatus]